MIHINISLSRIQYEIIHISDKKLFHDKQKWYTKIQEAKRDYYPIRNILCGNYFCRSKISKQHILDEIIRFIKLN